jgi:CheY-like chemotaxis protein
MARTLVVEDDVLLRYTLCEWLRTTGDDVAEAATVDEAKTTLASLAEIDLDVAILVVDRLDPCAIHCQQLATEQIQLLAQQHELTATPGGRPCGYRSGNQRWS